MNTLKNERKKRNVTNTRGKETHGNTLAVDAPSRGREVDSEDGEEPAFDVNLMNKQLHHLFNHRVVIGHYCTSRVCVCVYVCMCVCVYVYVYVCVCYACMYACMYVYIYVSKYPRICA